MSQQNQDGSVNLKVTHVAIDANNIDMLSVSSEFIKICNMMFWKRYGTVPIYVYIHNSIVSDTVSIY